MIHNKYFEIMEQFLGGYDREIYGRELVGKVSISQKNIALTLEELEKRGILSSKARGGAKYYFLNKQNSLFGRYILMFEAERTIEFLSFHKNIAEIFSKVGGSGIVCVFGSYAKGVENKNSDLDLLVIGENGNLIGKEGKNFGIDVSIKSGSKKEFRAMLKERGPFIREILENHVVIFGFEEFVSEVLNYG